MKVNSTQKSDISFNGFYNSQALKKILMFAENNGALFTSTTALALSATVRPAAIYAAPNTDMENKKLACAKSIISTILEFGITFAISLPIVRAVGRINKTPQKYLKKITIDRLKENNENLNQSKSYTLATQMLKLGVGLVVAIPKAILNVMGIPYLLNKQNVETKDNEIKVQPAFKGKEKNWLSLIIAKSIDNKKLQEFSVKHKNSNFPMNINAVKDILSTLAFSSGIYNSKKIDDERKGALIYNSLVSTAISIPLSYLTDSLTEKPAGKFTERFIKANKNDPNLKKCLDGFKIAKPVLIMGGMYYLLTPLISTFLAERIDNRFPIKNKL